MRIKLHSVLYLKLLQSCLLYQESSLSSLSQFKSRDFHVIGILLCSLSYTLYASLVSYDAVIKITGRSIARGMQTVYFNQSYPTQKNIRLEPFLYVSMSFEYILMLTFHVFALKLLMMHLMTSNLDLVRVSKNISRIL